MQAAEELHDELALALKDRAARDVPEALFGEEVEKGVLE